MNTHKLPFVKFAEFYKICIRKAIPKLKAHI